MLGNSQFAKKNGKLDNCTLKKQHYHLLPILFSVISSNDSPAVAKIQNAIDMISMITTSMIIVTIIITFPAKSKNVKVVIL